MVEKTIYKHRFVVHLPTLDNDGKRIPIELIQQTFDELESQFGSYTTSSYVDYPHYYGVYRRRDGTLFHDYIYMIYVDVEDGRNAARAINFFESFRIKCMKRFNQDDVYIVYYPVTKVE